MRSIAAAEDDELTTEEHRAVQHLGDELTNIVRRFNQHHLTIYVDLRMGTGRWHGPKNTQLSFFDLVPPQA